MSNISSQGGAGVKFSAVAFDLDGTLYPDSRFFIRLIPFLLWNHRLLWAMGKARDQLRDFDRDSNGNFETEIEDFYALQARYMGELLHQEPEKVRKRTERLIYRGWEPLFKRIKLFPHVRETLDAFRNEGIKMGLLSDFPPEAKLENLKIGAYWDAVLSSELTGHLKPAPAPFLELARRMERKPEEILYVGNNVRYDVKGARDVGMKTALILPGWKKRPSGGFPDFIFHDYRQLRDYVLG